METISVVAICMQLLVFGMLIYGGNRASEEKLLMMLKIDSILLLCFIPIVILLFFLLSLQSENFMSEILNDSFLIILILLLFCMPLITFVQYLLKRKQDLHNANDCNEADVSRYKKRLKIIMIPACVVPVAVFTFLLSYESVRSNRLLFLLLIAVICIYLFLLVFLMKKLKNDR